MDIENGDSEQRAPQQKVGFAASVVTAAVVVMRVIALCIRLAGIVMAMVRHEAPLY